MSNILKDKVAVVTGSGQGIGKSIAVAFAKEGAKVVTNSRCAGTENGDAETTAREIIDSGYQAISFYGSVDDYNTTQRLIQAAIDNFGHMDILVNNAGSDAPRMVWNMTEEEWDYCIDSYLKGTFNCIHHAAAFMKKQKWGRIVNTTSASWLGATGHCNYVAAKAGVVGLTRAVALELGRYNITCNAFAPVAATRFTLSQEVINSTAKQYEYGFLSKERYEELVNPPDPITVTPLLVYLCTDNAKGINGKVFDINGGKIGIYSEPAIQHTIVKENSLWTVEELVEQVPEILLREPETEPTE